MKALALECPDRIFISFLCTLKRQLGKIFATANEKSKNEGWQFSFFDLYDNKQLPCNPFSYQHQKKTLIESKSIVLLLSYFVFPRPSIKFVYLFLRYQYPSYRTLKIFLFLRQLIYRLNCFLVKSSFLLRGYSANDLYFFCLLIYLIIQSTFIHIYREEI